MYPVAMFNEDVSISRQENRHRQTLAVRETGVSRHQGFPIEGPPGTHRSSQHYHIEGIKEMET